MEREEHNDDSSLDREWENLSRSMARGTGGPAPHEAAADRRRPNPEPDAGPRDWTPAEEIDEPFDPSEIPEDIPAARSETTTQASVALIAGFVLLLIAVLSATNVLTMEPLLAGFSGFAGFILLVLAVRWFAPIDRNWDDDGARV